MTDKNDRLTTSAGAPVANNNHALTAGPRGPMLMQDVWFQEKLAHFDITATPSNVTTSRSGACTPRAPVLTGRSR